MCSEGCQCSNCYANRVAQHAKDTISESWDEEYVPAWKNAPPASRLHQEAWLKVACELLDYHKTGTNIPAMISMVFQKCGGTPIDFRTQSLQIERMLRTSDQFTLRKGKGGGIFRAGEARLGTPVTAVVTIHADNYTCGCGNSKLCTHTDKSCWRCGAEVR